MSEQVVANPAASTAAQPAAYILYDPARRRRRARRRYDPTLIAYEPRRRRRVRRYDPVRAGGKVLTDSLVDGLGFGLLFHAIPAIPEGSIAGFSYRDVGAAVAAAAYEKAYLKRGWSSVILGAIAAFATGKIVSSLGGWKP